MPGWSPEIANELICLAAADGRTLNQLQLQNLVYIAHGWCLAIMGQPLTGDRPEALDFGPAYRRLSDALASHGLQPVTAPISKAELLPDVPNADANAPARSELDQLERDILRRVYESYGAFSSAELAALTRRGSSPWRDVFDEGRGKFRDISHGLIRAQFVQLASRKASKT